MKKSLLIAVAAVMVTLGANAQVARVAQKTMGYAYQNDFKLENVMTKEYQAPVSKKLTTRRAASTIDGDYILNADNFEADFTASTSFTVASQSGTITLDMYDGAPSFEYNVVLNDFSVLLFMVNMMLKRELLRFPYRPFSHTIHIKKSLFLVVIVKEQIILAMARRFT